MTKLVTTFVGKTNIEKEEKGYEANGTRLNF
jgi:hypothetical protein